MTLISAERSIPSTVSVLIPTFNRGAWLPRVLESVFGQTRPPIEVIVVDDGSTDGSGEVIRRLLDENVGWRGRLHYIVQENQGKSAALNRALTCVSGEWIAYDDSDDLWHVDKLEWQFRALAAFPDCSVCFTDARFVPGQSAFERARKRYPERLGRIGDPLKLAVSGEHGIFMQTILVRKTIMDRVGEFDPRLRVGQDTDIILRLALQSGFCYVNLPLTDIDRSSERSIGLTTQYSRRSVNRLASGELMFTKWLTIIPRERKDVLASVRRLLSMFQSELAMSLLIHDSRAKARAAIRRSMRTRVSLRATGKLVLVHAAPRLMAHLLRKKRASGITKVDPMALPR
jgi:glycosyltransferase involved in cell wall biosynthesis